MCLRWGALLALAACGRLDFGNLAEPDADVGPALTLSVGMFQTSSADFVDIPGASINLPARDSDRAWLVLTSAELESTTFVNFTVEARYLVDGVEAGLGGTQNSVPERPGPWEHVYVLRGDGLPHVLTYQLRDAAASTATIRDLSAVAIEVDATATLAYAFDSAQVVSASTLSLLNEYDPGPLTGDYVVFLLVNASDAPGQSDLHVEWHGPGDAVWLADLQQPRQPWQSELVVRRVTFDGSPVTFQLYSRVGMSTSQTRYVRVVLVPTDQFADVQFAEDTSQTSTAQLAAVTGAALDPVAPATPAHGYVAITNERLREPCANVTDAERAVHVVVDDTTRSYAHATDNCAYETTYGAVEVLSTLPAHLAIGYSSLNGESVQYRGAQVLLLGLR